jgi:hypothetical protein
VPPLDGYDRDEGGCKIQVLYERIELTTETMLLALSTPKHAASALASALELLEPPCDAPISQAVRDYLLKPSMLAQFIVDPECAQLVKALIAKDPAIKAVAVASECFLKSLTPATASMAFMLLDNGAKLSKARKALLADDAKLLRGLVFAPNTSDLIDELCARDAEIRAAVASSEMLVAALSPSSAAVALRLMKTYNVQFSDAVHTELIEGQARVVSTTALNFERDIYLEDDGSALPLGNSDYTMEFWIRFSSKDCSFIGFGHEPENLCNGCHFEGHGFNHFWYGNDLHSGDGGRNLEKCWMHLGAYAHAHLNHSLAILTQLAALDGSAPR